MEKTFYESAMDALRNYVDTNHNGNVASAKNALGIKTDSLDKWLRGDRTPKLEAIGPILDAIGVSVQNTTKIMRLAEHSPSVRISGSNLVSVSVYGRAGAGPGAAISTAGNPLFDVMVPRDSAFSCDFALKVEGHSMEPTLPNQSIIGVVEVTNFIANELYVACIPYEGYVVKRVSVDRPAGEFVFKSDNPDKNLYPDFRELIDSALNIVIGKVKWVMSSI